MTGYVRQSIADIVTDEVVTALPLNNEFNAIEAAFDSSTGHTHDGTVGNSAKINLTDAVTDTLPVANGGTGVTTVADLKTLVSGTGLNADTVDGKNTQSSALDRTVGALMSVGAFGMGYQTDLRGTIYETGLPSALFSTGRVIGMADGGPSHLNISSLPDNTLGVLETNMFWGDASAPNAGYRKFTLGTGDVYFQKVASATAWTPWVLQPTVAGTANKVDVSTYNADMATVNANITANTNSISTTNTNLATTNSVVSTKLDAASYTAADVLTKIKTVDGTGSGLDADLLDGQDATYYTAITSRLGYTPINKAGDSSIGQLQFTSGTSVVGSNTIAARPTTGAASLMAQSTNSTASLTLSTSGSSNWSGAVTSTDYGDQSEWQSYGSTFATGTRFSAGPGGTAFSAPRNLELGSYGNYPLNFYTNNTARLRLFANGYMGFGGVVNSATATSGEGVLFNPSGQIQLRGTAAAGGGYLSFYTNSDTTPLNNGLIYTSGNDLNIAALLGTVKVSGTDFTFGGQPIARNGMHPNFTNLDVSFTDNTHYGFIQLMTAAGTRGAYLGYGTAGLSQIDFWLDGASYLNIIKGSNPYPLLLNGAVALASDTLATYLPAALGAMGAADVGTYVFGFINSAAAFGATTAGANLRTSDANNAAGTFSVGGTLQCHGMQAATSVATLWKRIA